MVAGAGAGAGAELLTSDEARQASVHASLGGAVHAVRLGRDDFHVAMKGWRERQMEDICDFLARQPMFARWIRTRLTRLVARIQVRNPHVGENIMEQGKPCDAVYIVRKGSLAIRHATQQPHENRWPASNDEAEAALDKHM